VIGGAAGGLVSQRFGIEAGFLLLALALAGAWIAVARRPSGW